MMLINLAVRFALFIVCAVISSQLSGQEAQSSAQSSALSGMGADLFLQNNKDIALQPDPVAVVANSPLDSKAVPVVVPPVTSTPISPASAPVAISKPAAVSLPVTPSTPAAASVGEDLFAQAAKPAPAVVKPAPVVAPVLPAPAPALATKSLSQQPEQQDANAAKPIVKNDLPALAVVKPEAKPAVVAGPPAISTENKAKLAALDASLSKNTIKPETEALAPMPKVEKLDPLAEVSKELDKINESTKDLGKVVDDKETDDEVDGNDDGEKPVVIKESMPVVLDEKSSEPAVDTDKLTKDMDALKTVVDKVKSELSLLAARVEKLEKATAEAKSAASTSSFGQFTYPLMHALSHAGEVVRNWVLSPIQNLFVGHESKPVVVKGPAPEASK
ncbi:MAG: hypothetical protein QG632_95 [Candidatus Dependentiae bacterium]|nr:hypothetical protein [Candidatus Dependentiae bacterium]